MRNFGVVYNLYIVACGILFGNSAFATQYSIEAIRLGGGGFLSGYAPDGASGIDINNRGHISGNESTSRGFFASQVGDVWMRDYLPGTGGPTSPMYSRAYDLNNNDVIAGWQNVCSSYSALGSCQAAQYHAAAFSKPKGGAWSAKLIDTSGSAIATAAFSVNDDDVPAWSKSDDVRVISNSGGTVVREGFGYKITHLQNNTAVTGVIAPVGMSSTGVVAFHESFSSQNALLFNAVSGKFMNAGVDKEKSYAWGVNENGDAVGESWINDEHRFHSFVTLGDGNTVDLSAMLEVKGPKSWVDSVSHETRYVIGWHSLDVATGINDNGEIVGLGTYSDGAHIYTQRVFLIRPVPEPQTYVMLLAGLGLVGWRARSRRQR